MLFAKCWPDRGEVYVGLYYKSFIISSELKKKRFFTKKSLKSYDDACYLTFLLQAFPKEKNPFGSDPSPVSRAKSK